MHSHQFRLRDDPFAAGHDPRFVFSTAERRQTVSVLIERVRQGEPFLLLSGDAGTGKTSIVAELRASGSGAIFASAATTPSDSEELIAEIVRCCGVPIDESSTGPERLAELERRLCERQARGERVVIVFDEAHELAPERLEELRVLATMGSGGPLFQVLLVARTEMEKTLGQSELDAFRHRIGAHRRTEALSTDDTRRYLRHRVAVAGGRARELFPDETCIEIHDASHGVPGAINAIAALALTLATRDKSRAVTAEHVRAAAAEWAPADHPAPAPSSPKPAADTPAYAPASAAPEPEPEPYVAAPREPETSRPAPAPAPASEPQAEAPVARTAPETVRPATRAPAPMAASAPAPAPAAASTSNPVRDPHKEAEVKAWVSRFAGMAGPPRIGSRVTNLQVEAGSRAELSTARPTAAPARASRGTPIPPLPVFPAPAAADATFETTTPEPESTDVTPARPRAPAAPPRRSSRRSFLSDPALATSRPAIAAAGVLALMAVVFLVAHGRRPGPASIVTSASTRSGAPAAASLAAKSAKRTDMRKRGAKAKDPVADRSVRAIADPSVMTPAPAEAEKPQKLGLEVASYLNYDRAVTESGRLENETGLSARVVKGREGGETIYRVVLGSFTSRDEAESAADEFVQQGVLDQARVVPLGGSKRRR